MILIVVVGLVALIVLFLAIFFNTAPQIGGTAEGERLQRMQASSQYKEGKFTNTAEFEEGFSISRMAGAMWAFLTEGTQKEPEMTIETHQFSQTTFDTIPDDDIAVSWFGHSSLLIKLEGKTILTDPIFSSDRASMFSFAGPKQFPYTHYMTVDQLPEIDAVIISHDHYDHLDYETILDLQDKISHFYMPLGVGAHFESWGVPAEKIIEMDWWESTMHDSLELILTPTQHFSGRGFSDRNHTLWGSWVIKGQVKRLYFSGDSGYFPGFKEIGEKYGPFDLTMLECGAYNKRWLDKHMLPEETVQSNVDLSGKVMLPIHWGKYSLATHAWKEPAERMLVHAGKLDVRYTTPEVGIIIRLSEALPTKKWWEIY